MGDYAFGLLQANIDSGPALFGAFRSPYSSLPSVDGDLLPSASPPLTRPLTSRAASPLFQFHSAAAHRRTMQDEPAGVTTEHRQVESTEHEQARNAVNRSPPAGSRNSHNGHNQGEYELSDYNSNPTRFCPAPSRRDLERNTDPECALQGRGQLPDPVGTAAPVSLLSSPVTPSKVQMDSTNAHLVTAGFPNLPHQEMQTTLGGGSVSPAPPSLPGFGAPWSVHTSSPPPRIPNNGIMPSISSTEPDTGCYSSIPSSMNPGFFQSFPPVSAGVSAHSFGAPYSPQMGGAPNRRSPLSPQHGTFLQQRNTYNQQQPMMKQSLWGNGWNSGSMSWGRDHRSRGVGMTMPGSLGQISLMKKPFGGSSVIAPPKFPRSGASYGHKTWSDDNVFHTDNNSNTLLSLQDRSRMYDSLNMHSLESSLIDIIRAEQEPLKARSYGRRRGRSSLFPIDDGLLDDGHGNQGVLGSGYPHQNGDRIERFSRKVFVGGLPPDIDEDEITSSFRRFGHLVVDWPHKAESKSYFPPKGYAFLLFQDESSVQALIEACLEEDGKLYLCVSSPTIKDKPVQIRPWNLGDSDFVMDGSQPLDPRKTIFVGGVPRPLRAVELAMIMDRLYGGVCYAGIDTDPELKYPKGAGRVAFSNQQSYIAAISARFVQLQHGDIDKRVEVKPYVLDDQLCDECQGARCGSKFAPFFCANVTCLQYYCEFCWANIHSRAGREFHKPLVKEGADRPRQIHFRWN
ncbi:cytoplasmic polyadenylation element-binding protein 2 [Trichomycterus rosablanca]|uniref:cytoplasmic polyadenylation element-binding protein 2 n=1 Tax=Trichomycterus rosablanca TaxID=2290929 RepID=UPI002F3561EA